LVKVKNLKKRIYFLNFLFFVKNEIFGGEKMKKKDLLKKLEGWKPYKGISKEEALCLCKYQDILDSAMKKFGGEFLENVLNNFIVETNWIVGKNENENLSVRLKKDELIHSSDFVAITDFSEEPYQFKYNSKLLNPPADLVKITLGYDKWGSINIYLISHLKPQYYRGFRVLFGKVDGVVKAYIDALLSIYPDIKGGKIDASYAHNNLLYYLNEVDKNGFEAARYRILCVFSDFKEANVAKEIATFRGMLTPEKTEKDTHTEEEYNLYDYAHTYEIWLSYQEE